MSYVCPTCRSLIPGEPPAAPREDVEALVNDLEDAICNLSSDDYNQAAGIIYKVRRALRSRTQEPRDVWRERWNDLYQRMSNMATAPGDDGEYGVAFLCTMLDVKRSITAAPSEESATQGTEPKEDDDG